MAGSRAATPPLPAGRRTALHGELAWGGDPDRDIDRQFEIGRHLFVAEFDTTGNDPATGSAIGTLMRSIDTEPDGCAEIMTQPGSDEQVGKAIGLAARKAGGLVEVRNRWIQGHRRVPEEPIHLHAIGAVPEVGHDDPASHGDALHFAHGETCFGATFSAIALTVASNPAELKVRD